MFDPASLKLECLSGGDTFKEYLLQIVLAPVILCYYSCCYFASVFLPQRFRWRFDPLVNVCLTVFQMFLIGFTNIALMPFQCYKHPNGDESMINYPAILCNSTEIVAYSIFGL